MSEPQWLLRSVVDAVHDVQIAEHGGAAGLHDDGLLDSTLARPRQLFAYGETDLFALAAAYASTLVRNHPFADGNKRTGFLAAYVFLAINGYELIATETAAAQMMFTLAADEIAEHEFAAWLRDNCRPND